MGGLGGLSDKAWSFIGGVLVIAILYVIVRPVKPGQPTGVQIIDDILNALASIVKTAVA